MSPSRHSRGRAERVSFRSCKIFWATSSWCDFKKLCFQRLSKSPENAFSLKKKEFRVEPTIGQLLRNNFPWALLLLTRSQKENRFGRAACCLVVLSLFSLLWSWRDERGWFKSYCCDSTVRQICIRSNASLTQNEIRKGGNLILFLWLWRSAGKWACGAQSSGHVLVRQLRGFFMPFFFRTWCQML